MGGLRANHIRLANTLYYFYHLHGSTFSLLIYFPTCVCVSGLDINHAPLHLLKKISGLGPNRAISIMRYRDTYGGFVSRQQLMEVRSTTYIAVCYVVYYSDSLYREI